MRIVTKWWWLVAGGALVVMIASIVFVVVRPPEYEATATMLVSPVDALANLDEVRASLVALDKPVVANTYAEIAQSSTVQAAAWEELGLSVADQLSYEIRSSVRQRTNIIEITAKGSDPVRAQEIANSVAKHTMLYVDGLYEVYDLRFLDQARFPNFPVGLDNRLTLVVGLILGLALGVMASFLAEYLQRPPELTRGESAQAIGQTEVVQNRASGLAQDHDQ